MLSSTLTRAGLSPRIGDTGRGYAGAELPVDPHSGVHAVGPNDEFGGQRLLLPFALVRDVSVPGNCDNRGAVSGIDPGVGLDGVEENRLQVAPPKHQHVVQAVAVVGRYEPLEWATRGISERGLTHQHSAREKLVAEPEAIQDGDPVGLQQDAGADRAGLGDALEQHHLRSSTSEQQGCARATNPTADHHDRDSDEGRSARLHLVGLQLRRRRHLALDFVRGRPWG